MKVAVIGTGYVGLVAGACIADMGNNVTCVDKNIDKLEQLKQGVIPIYEPGLEEIVKRNVKNGNLDFTTDLSEPLKFADVVFSAVGTPPKEDGSADLRYVIAAARQFGQLIEHYAVFVTKSTVPVGTAKKVKDAIYSELKARGKEYIEFDVASNPEFLKEGTAVSDFMNPERVIIGTETERAEELLKELYKPHSINNPLKVISMDIPSAELTKYACNAMLATRISFMNEIAGICEAVGANIDDIRKGMGTDTRIGSKFLYAGCGYGGSCFPKDVKALASTAKEKGVSAQLIETVDLVNERQKRVPLARITKELGNVKGKNFVVWGLAFKPKTDDIREAPSLVLIDALCDCGANVYAYDPIAMDNVAKWADEHFKTEAEKNRLHLMEGKFNYPADIDAIVLLTEWGDFFNIDWSGVALRSPSCKLVFDGRNIYKREEIERSGMKYIGIGK